jgi:hypothetical protein
MAAPGERRPQGAVVDDDNSSEDDDSDAEIDDEFAEATREAQLRLSQEEVTMSQVLSLRPSVGVAIVSGPKEGKGVLVTRCPKVLPAFRCGLRPGAFNHTDSLLSIITCLAFASKHSNHSLFISCFLPYVITRRPHRRGERQGDIDHSLFNLYSFSSFLPT